MWKVSEDDERAIEENANENGDVSQPTNKEMEDLNNWVHANSSILGCNRTIHSEVEDNPENPDFDAEEEKKKMEAADPFEPRLKQLTKDGRIALTATTKVGSSCLPWVIKHVGDTEEYLAEPSGKCSYSCVIVRSLNWPGAYSIYQNGQINQIYIGNGLKYEIAPTIFKCAPKMKADPQEYNLCPEPNP